MAFTLTQPLYAQNTTGITAQQDRLLIQANANTAGVLAIPTSTTGDLAVTTTGAANASVNVTAGHVWINAGSGQGFYYAYNDATTVVGPIASNSSGSTRTDLITVKVNTLVTPYTVDFAIVPGAVPPYTVANSTVLATITVKNGFIGSGAGIMQVFNADGVGVNAYITDVRPKAQLADISVPATSYIGSPAVGNLVLDTSVNKAKVYTSSGWATLATTATSGFTNADMATGYLLTYQGAAAPTSPTEGMLWYDTANRIYKEYFYNGSTYSWIPLLPQAWTSFTPTLWDNATVAATVNHARYTQIGKTVHGVVQLTATAAGAANTTGIQVRYTAGDLPAPATSGAQVGSGLYHVNAGNFYNLTVTHTSSQQFYFFVDTQYAYAFGSSNNGSAPGNRVVGISDYIRFHFTYEAA